MLAAHWIDLHGPAEEPDCEPGRVLAGTERAVRSGADGTPEISEFACAEFAALQDLHPAAGAALLRKVANLPGRDHRPDPLGRPGQGCAPGRLSAAVRAGGTGP